MKRKFIARPGRGIVASRILSNNSYNELSVGDVIDKLINECYWSEEMAYDTFEGYPDDKLINKEDLYNAILSHDFEGLSYSELNEIANECINEIFN